MLVASVVIIIKAPKCPSPEPKQWWQKSPVYEVYVKSFKDSNEDGNGDLQGVASKLDYLKGLGIGSVYLSNIYRWPRFKIQGQVVQGDPNLKEVDPTFGTMEDFDKLLDDIHAKDMKVIMDFFPNESTDEAKLVDILQFWVDKGVDGFRVDLGNEVKEGQGFAETIDLLKKLRAVLDEASKDDPTEPRYQLLQQVLQRNLETKSQNFSYLTIF